MYEDKNSKNRLDQQIWRMRGPFDTARRPFVSPNPYYHASGSLMSHFNPRIRSLRASYPSQSTYSQGVNPQQHKAIDYTHQILQDSHSESTQNMKVVHHNNWVNNTAKFQPEHYISFNYKGNNSVYGPESITGCHQGNTLDINQSQTHVAVNHGARTQPYVQQNDVPCLHTMGHFRQFQPNSVSTFPNQVPSRQSTTSHGPNQEETDKVWLKQWLEQRHVQSTDENVDKPTKTLKICEAHNLFHRYLSLNNELKQERDELAKNIECEPAVWNRYLAKAEQIKEEIMFVEEVFNNQDVIRDLQEKISKRRQKRLWLKNRKIRCYLEKQDDQQQRKKLHENINRWQTEIRKKDLAARKAASLKHEAGGVLGEVRRKLQDSHKLRELIKSLVKLREIRKSEGEKKGVYPKTSSTEDRNFTTRCEYVDNMVLERIRNYEEEEKALRVIIMEEEGEREKKEKQERLEQKALLNLSKEADPLADFRRYYTQADESIEYLIKIRREWDMYLTPDIAKYNRVPDENITAVPAASGLWASVLEAGD